ncbi:MAG: DUF4445 domain-containing protein [Firmicutes bacterium]|nr:DUF4445 domain-containing protein [Bacillota bacterium]
MITLSVPSAGIKLNVRPGTRLFDALRQARVRLYSPCGGRGVCGKCRVVVREGVSPPSDVELRLLDGKELEAGIRLACQTVLTGDAVVRAAGPSVDAATVPAASGAGVALSPEPGAILSWGYSAAAGGGEPRVRTRAVEVDLESQDGEPSDWERVAAALGTDGGAPPTLALARRLPAVLRGGAGAGKGADAVAGRPRVCAVLLDGTIVDVVDTERDVFGVALDIGTTTVVAYLVNLVTGETVNVEGILNPQAAYGADLISRISFAETPDGLETLRREIVGAVNDLIRRLTSASHVDSDQVYLVGAVGNTCMHHLFLGIPPKHLARYPYNPVVRQCNPLAPAEVGLDAMNERGQFFFLPNIAGFVGSDALAVAVACGMSERSDPVLAIDLGTNGEIILAGQGRVLACSTAAGPAFEGVNISCGMMAAPGAIDAARLIERDGALDMALHVIGGGPPLGICGSGLVSLVAALRRAGIVDETGAFVRKDGRPPGPLESRLVEGRGGLEFLLFSPESDHLAGPGYDPVPVEAPGDAQSGGKCEGGSTGEDKEEGNGGSKSNGKGEWAPMSGNAGGAGTSGGTGKRSNRDDSITGRGPTVVLTQRDIRELQLAKGAIRAGAEILLQELGINAGEISRVFLAGAFGTYLDKDAAAAIGLLPPTPRASVTSVGNAAGEGAVLAITSRDAYREALRLARKIEHVELGAHARFQEIFAESMTLEAG